MNFIWIHFVIFFESIFGIIVHELSTKAQEPERTLQFM